MKLDSIDKVAIITGGTTGIGFEIGKLLYQLGYKVVITSRSKGRAKKAVSKIDKNPDRTIGIEVNYNFDSEVNRLVSSVLKRFGRIDVLINNTGIFGPFGPFENSKMKDHVRNLEINLIGTMRFTHKIIPVMKKQHSGKIIMLSGGGVGGDSPLVNAASYYTSKSAITALTEVLAAELSPFNIQVNAVLPGRILTNMTKSTFKIAPELLGPRLTEITEDLKKNGGERLQPFLDLIAFLTSNRSNHLTGRLLSAKWDSISELLKDVPKNKFNLRRIDGKVYRRSQNG